MLEIEEERKKERDPMAEFRYGLRAPDTKRQYPRRFQHFLNFLQIQGRWRNRLDNFLQIKRKFSQDLTKPYVIYRIS